MNIAKALAGQPVASGGNPDWANVVLQIGNDNGANGSTTIIDQSNSAHTVTSVGGAAWTNAQAPAGMTTSIATGGGAYLTVPDSPDWDFGNGDFKVEGWIRLNSTTSKATLAAQYAALTSNASFMFLAHNGSDHNAYFERTANGTANQFDSRAWTPAAATWYAFCASRVGNNFRFFVDGIILGTAIDVTGLTIFNSTSVLMIARAVLNDGSFDTDGHHGPLRITKGVGISANYTVPSLPLPTS